jgi:hypothetical protein
MGVEHLITFPNFFTTMYIKDGSKDGRLWWLLREGIVNG